MEGLATAAGITIGADSTIEEDGATGKDMVIEEATAIGEDSTIEVGAVEAVGEVVEAGTMVAEDQVETAVAIEVMASEVVAAEDPEGLGRSISHRCSALNRGHIVSMREVIRARPDTLIGLFTGGKETGVPPPLHTYNRMASLLPGDDISKAGHGHSLGCVAEQIFHQLLTRLNKGRNSGIIHGS